MSTDLTELEGRMQSSVYQLETTLNELLVDLRLRMDYGSKSEGYYWENCREVVIRIKNQVHKLNEWVHP